MNRTLPFAFAMASALAAPSLVAQAVPATSPAGPAAAAASAVPPQAIPAKVAVIDVQAVIVNSNEGQRAFADINKKFEPQKNKIESEGAEVET